MDRMPVTSQLSDKNMKRCNLFLSKKLIEAYRVMALEKGVSSAEMTRIAMEKYHLAYQKAKKHTSDMQQAEAQHGS